MLCTQAYQKYKERLLDQHIVLIMHGRYSEEWWEEIAHEENNSTCTKAEILKALNSTLILTPDTYALMEDPAAYTFSNTVRFGKTHYRKSCISYIRICSVPTHFLRHKSVGNLTFIAVSIAIIYKIDNDCLDTIKTRGIIQHLAGPATV